MSGKERSKPLNVGELEKNARGGKTEHGGSGLNPKSADRVQTQKRGVSKTDSRFWLQQGKMKKRDGRAVFDFQFQLAGRRFTFSTRTGNKEAAAKIAARIYSDFVEQGMDAALKIHRSTDAKEVPVSLGEWIALARGVFGGNVRTFEAYAQAARQVAGDLLKVVKTKKRFGRKGGEFAKQAEDAPLSIFSPAAVQEWRLSYARAKGGANPAKLRSARTSCNAILRNARSLFSEKIRKFLPALEVAVPFEGVEFFPRESMRYQSKIDAGVLLANGRDTLAKFAPEAFKVLLLTLGAGLRRGEIDALLWRQIDLARGILHVEVTSEGSLKSEDSSGAVDLDATLCAMLRDFKQRAKSQFFIEGGGGLSGATRWGRRYRCQEVFDCLIAWLREQGVEGHRPIHTLRKEAGALIASAEGIYAASRFLRHADIQVTAAHYADMKKRVTVDIGALLPPENIEVFPRKKA